jgi:hypothetical protein
VNDQPPLPRLILRADGRREDFDRPLTLDECWAALDDAIPNTVRLPEGRVMLCDDNAYAKGLPVNVEATRLYHTACRPGTRHQIRGPAVVVLLDDYPEGEF